MLGFWNQLCNFKRYEIILSILCFDNDSFNLLNSSNVSFEFDSVMLISFSCTSFHSFKYCFAFCEVAWNSFLSSTENFSQFSLIELLDVISLLIKLSCHDTLFFNTTILHHMTQVVTRVTRKCFRSFESLFSIFCIISFKCVQIHKCWFMTLYFFVRVAVTFVILDIFSTVKSCAAIWFAFVFLFHVTFILLVVDFNSLLY